MTSQTSKNGFGWRNAVTGTVAGSALAAGLLLSVGVPSAAAQPSTKEPVAPSAPTGDVLGSLYEQYATGAGGGQISNWVKEAMQLRAMGFRPSNRNLIAIEDSLRYRPNQTPLVDALKDTVAYQRKLQSQAAGAVAPGGFTAGINQPPPGIPPGVGNPDNTGVFLGPSGGFQLPMG